MASDGFDQTTLVREVVEVVVSDISSAFPRLAAGFAFLLIAGLGVHGGLKLVRQGILRVLPGDENIVYRRFVGRGVAVVAWFGVLLTFLSIVGLQELAAALGTATGFVALGISYALKDMMADAVSGVYLLRDPDFMPGQRVTAAGVTGEIEQIELRKTRIRLDDDDIVVIANGQIESDWTRHTDTEAREIA